MSITESHAPDRTTVSLSGVLDFLSAPELRAVIRHVLAERPPLLVVDLTHLDQIDGSGVAALVSLLRRITQAGTRVDSVGAHGQPREVFRSTGLLEFLH